MQSEIAIFAEKMNLGQKQRVLLTNFINKLKKKPNDNDNSRNQNCVNFTNGIRLSNYRWGRLGLEFIVPETYLSETAIKIAHELRSKLHNFPEPILFTPFFTTKKQKILLYKFESAADSKAKITVFIHRNERIRFMNINKFDSAGYACHCVYKLSPRTWVFDGKNRVLAAAQKNCAKKNSKKFQKIRII